MTDIISTTAALQDVSLRFCAKCLKKFCPQRAQMNSEAVRFFVPTLDALFRNHFAYIELPKKMIDAIYEVEEHFSIDLSEIAEVLHVEIGEFPSWERKEEIKSFYSYSKDRSCYFTNPIKVN